MNMNRTTGKLSLASAFAMAMLLSTTTLASPDQTKVVTEARQSSQILTTYALNPHLQAHEIKVSVDGGVATLSGKVDEGISKELAEQIALNVDGIKKVNNQIEVDPDYRPSASSKERNYGQAVSDASITATVKSKLLWSKHVDGLSTNVETKSGKVTLEGTAHTDEAKQFAGLVASNTHGVNSVENNIKIAKTDDKKSSKEKDRSDIGQSISDTWITTKVKSTLMYSSNINSSDISVSTSNGAVTLSGKVNSGAEHDLAVELVKNVRGVITVNSENLRDNRS
jgi:hyperosmotically inducible periplasmic protein